MMVESRWVSDEITAPRGAFHGEQQTAGVAVLNAQLRRGERSACVSKEVDLRDLHRVGGSRIPNTRENHAVGLIGRAVAERYDAAKRISRCRQRERAGRDHCPALGSSRAVIRAYDGLVR